MADALGLHWADPFEYFGGGFGFNNFTLNQSTDKLEIIFQARRAATLTRLGVRLGTITGTTPIYRVSLQGVSDGIPDGTIKGATNNALKTFSPSSLGWSNNTWHWLDLDETYACTRGEMLSLVIEYSSGTVDASNNASFTSWVTSSGQSFRRPYPIHNDNGSRTRQSNMPIWGYGSATVAYGRPILAITSLGAFQSGSNPNEYAVKFTLPAGWTNTFEVDGFEQLATIAAAGSQTWRLYDGGLVTDVTPLQEVTIDSDFAASAGQGTGFAFFDEATLSTLTAGNTYRLACLAASATNVTLFSIDVEAAADWDAWPGGQNVASSSRNGGNWTDLTTRRLFGFKPTFADFTEPAGGAAGGAPIIGIGGPIIRGAA